MADRHRREGRPESVAGSVKRVSGNGGRKGGQMQNLLGEFKGLYEGKLKRLDESERTGEDTNKVSWLSHSSVRFNSTLISYELFL